MGAARKGDKRGRPMEEKEREHDTCMIPAADEQGNPNLCCCYIVNPDGNREDPCYRPVDGCCCSEPELIDFESPAQEAKIMTVAEPQT